VNVWIVADVPGEIPGGMMRHMLSHAEGVRRLGHRATVFFSDAFASSGNPKIDRRTSGLRSCGSLLARAWREAPDIVNVHSLIAPAWIAAQRLGLLGRTRIVVMSYGADERAMPPQAGVRAAASKLRIALPARAAIPRAAGIWCLNSEDRAFYVGRYHVDPGRITIIPHAVADMFYQAAAEGSRRRRRLLFVGTWIARKGVQILAGMLPGLMRQIPDLELVLAGTITGEREVRASFPEHVQRAITVLPVLRPEELRRLYDESTLLLVPSELEGLPIVLLEAMARGCPSLSAANSGMKDVIEDGKNGWLLESREPHDWAARVGSLLVDEVALQRVGETTRAFAERFRIETVASQALGWYESLLGRSPVGMAA
jgi:glycosyltransferase involved in cell wall biosynthesis